MNNLRILTTFFTISKQLSLGSFRSYHKYKFSPSSLQGKQGFDGSLENALFFTNLPKQRKGIRLKRRKKILPTGTLKIQCKRPELNHFSGMVYGKFDTVPLASKGWHHSKSKGDYFTILPTDRPTAFLTKEDLPTTFEEYGVSEKVIEELKKLNIFYPTTIQAKALTHLLKGENLLMSGECGSGKTIGYLIGMVENVLKQKENLSPEHNSPIGIILLPTRELALQVGVLADKIGGNLGVKCQALLGGDIEKLLQYPEMAEIDILACTLNVFLKHIKAELYSTKFCRHVVFDEADSFIEKTFLGQVKAFFSYSKLEFTGLNAEGMSKNPGYPFAQICFCSSIVPKALDRHICGFIKGSKIATETTPYLHKTQSFARQIFMRMAKSSKPENLLKIVKSNMKTKTPTMIFSNKRSTANWVCKFLTANGIECGSVSSKAYAKDRLTSYRDFEEGLIHVLSSTDLASRGLSFTRVKHVINYEFPTFMIDYIHRCGRTGRIDQGPNCKVTNFICGRKDLHLLHQIELAVRMNSALPSLHQDRIKPVFKRRRGVRASQ